MTRKKRKKYKDKSDRIDINPDVKTTIYYNKNYSKSL